MALITANTGSNNWNTNGCWVGGVQPTAADDVVIPASAVVTLPTATTCLARSVTVAASATLIWASTSAILAIGDGTAGLSNVALSISSSATITLTGIGTIQFLSTSATQQTIATGGKTLPIVTMGGAGSSYLQSDAMICSGAWTMTAGTWNTGNFNLTATQLVSSGAGTATLTPGSSTLTTTSNNTPISFSGTNKTLTANTSTVNTNPTVNPPSWGGFTTWNNIVMSGAGNSIGTNSSNLTCANFTRTGTAAKGDGLVLQGTITCSGTFTCNGNSTVNRIFMVSSIPGTSRTVTAATFSCSNTTFADINAQGTGAPISGTYIGDGLGNTNITFTVHVGGTSNGGNGVNLYWIGNAGFGDVGTNWSFTSGGSAANVTPLPQDDIFFDANSFNGSTQRAQLNIPQTCRNLDTTGCNQTSTTVGTSSGTNIGIFGNLKYAGTAVDDGNASGQVTYYGRGNQTITNNGGLRYGSQVISAPGGTYTLQDNFQTTNSNNKSVAFTYGTFDGNDKSLAWQVFTINSTMTKVYMRSGTWQIVLSAGGTGWSMNAAASVLDAGTSTINWSNTSSALRTFAGGGAAYNIVNMQNNGSTGAMVISGSNYFDTLTFRDTTNARTLQLTNGTLTTARNFDVVGTSGKLMTVNSTTGAAAAFLELVGAVDTNDYLSVQDIFSTIPYKFYAGANSTSVSGNTNVLIAASVSQPYIYKQAENNATTNSLVTTFPWAQAAAAGELLVASYTSTANPGVVTTPSGWTAIDNNTVSTEYMYTFYKVAAGGETSVTIATGNSVAGVTKLLGIGNFSGTPTLDVKDKNTTAGATSLATNGTNPSNTVQPAIAIAWWGAVGTMGATVSFNNGFQEQREVTQQTLMRTAAAPLTSLAAVNVTNTWTTSRAAVAQLAVFYGAAGTAWTQNLNDSITSSDANADNVVKNLSDSDSPTDSSIRKPTLNKTDSTSPTDSLVKSIVKALLDTEVTTDSATRSATFARTAADSITSIDSILKAFTKNNADTITSSDSLTRKSISKLLSDSITSTDSLNRIIAFVRALSDSVSANDLITLTMHFVKLLSDTVTATDHFSYTNQVIVQQIIGIILDGAIKNATLDNESNVVVIDNRNGHNAIINTEVEP